MDESAWCFGMKNGMPLGILQGTAGGLGTGWVFFGLGAPAEREEPGRRTGWVLASGKEENAELPLHLLRLELGEEPAVYGKLNTVLWNKTGKLIVVL